MEMIVHKKSCNNDGEWNLKVKKVRFSTTSDSAHMIEPSNFVYLPFYSSEREFEKSRDEIQKKLRSLIPKF